MIVFTKDWKYMLVLLLIMVVSVQSYLLYSLSENRKYIIKRRDEDIGRLEEALAKYISKDIRLENMEKTLQKMYQLSEWEARYYSILYDDFSQESTVPWEIYPATVRIESNFNPTLKSKAGAAGLTQVMPSTAMEVCEMIGLKFDPKVTLWNDLLCQVIGFTYLTNSIKQEADSNNVLGEDALKHGIKVYLGGPDYLSSIKTNGATGQYVYEYKSSVWIEYERLHFVYKGVCSDNKKNGEDILEYGRY